LAETINIPKNAPPLVKISRTYLTRYPWTAGFHLYAHSWI